MKRLIPLFLVISLVAWPLIAESTWEGTTAVSRYGEFPESGNYGASNSFAVNTAVTVKNLDNGMETKVIIVDRLENPNLFLLVSRDAARELGISSGEISRVRASITHPGKSLATFPDDLPFNPDPDVNPAASITNRPDILETVSPAETIDEAAEVAETDETVETVEVAEADETVEVVEIDETAEVAEADETADETVEVTVADEADVADAVDDSPPKINGVDAVVPPPEEQPPSEVADEPSPPAETEDRVAVSALSSADDTADTDPRLIVESPPDPPVDQDEVPLVLDLMPAPVLDQTEKFVLLAEPDAPDVSELVDTREPELEKALRISSLDEPSALEDEIIEAIIPPEPVFEETVIVEEAPVAEDILIVSDLIEPTALAEASYDLPLIADEPDVIEGVIADEPELRYSLLDEPVIPEIGEVTSVAAHEPSFESARITLIDDPAESESEGLADLGLDEPVFIAKEAGPSEYEDILIVTDLNTPADPDESVEALAMAGRDEPVISEIATVEEEEIPVVVNGFTPPVYDPDEIDIVLEPAEPKPPEPRIAGADLLDTAVAGDIPPTEIAVEDVAKPEVRDKAVAVITPEVEKPVSETTVAPPLEYTTRLAGESFYLQLAAFSKANSAAKLKDDLAGTYPVTVYLTESTERPVYKVLVGPLNQDESGALLYRFRVRGFPDAFVRAGAVN